MAFCKAALTVVHEMHLFVILGQYCMYLDSAVRLVGWSPCLCSLCFLSPNPPSAAPTHWQKQLPGITSQHLTSLAAIQYVRTIYFQDFLLKANLSFSVSGRWWFHFSFWAITSIHFLSGLFICAKLLGGMRWYSSQVWVAWSRILI